MRGEKKRERDSAKRGTLVPQTTLLFVGNLPLLMDTGIGSETVHDNSLKRPYLGETPRVPPVSLARRSPAACNNTLHGELSRARRGALGSSEL